MLNKVRQKLKEAGIDALLSYDPLNQRYLTGFSFTDGAVLITKEKAYLVTDFRYIEAASNVISEEIEALIEDMLVEFNNKDFCPTEITKGTSKDLIR